MRVHKAPLRRSSLTVDPRCGLYGRYKSSVVSVNICPRRDAIQRRVRGSIEVGIPERSKGKTLPREPRGTCLLRMGFVESRYTDTERSSPFVPMTSTVRNRPSRKSHSLLRCPKSYRRQRSSLEGHTPHQQCYIENPVRALAKVEDRRSDRSDRVELLVH